MIQKCELCRFWVRWSNRDYGTCRRHPPQKFMLKDIISVREFTEWPETYPDQGCGEFEQRNTTKTEP